MPRRLLAGWLVLVGGAALTLLACDIEERDDFLVGRVCDPDLSSACDPGQRCLPHMFEDDRLFDFRCRDVASFERVDGIEPPLAYCDSEGSLVCPGSMVCRPDRIRSSPDGGFSVRRLVCQSPDSPFGPPLPDGGA